ncbi:tetratricopeptide repeat protein [Sphingomicrobium marinum]|uniref:tetratricopeptide repeat protein n=1 Tax=Sphingomicrobium marinum TaxID=1227950 RepID=UPI00223FE0FD|nr:tetratricopeptide repeat protein [Sphingomicrobium marinum]
MKRLLIAILATLFVVQPAFAQESDSRRERENRDRIERLERQVRQMQKEVYPEGRPADTAGFYDEPVATRQSVDILTGRVDTLERQLATLIRESQESQYRLGQMEAEIARLRGEMVARPAAPAEEDDPPLVSTPRFETDDEPVGGDIDTPANDDEPIAAIASNDPNFELAGEEAYIEGYRLWNDGNNQRAITVLRAMETSFPGHRRVSWARNLIGRALLDSGQPRAAAEALLANYRNDPKGERAADSLFFLGQALMELNQPGQACRAYDELEEVYGSSVREYLRERLPNARARANCS